MRARFAPANLCGVWRRYEIMAQLGALLKEGGEGLEPDYEAAAQYYNQVCGTHQPAHVSVPLHVSVTVL